METKYENQLINLFQIIGSNGQLIKNIQVDDQTNKHNLDLENLESGIYFVKVLWKNGMIKTSKFIKI
ncbi:MAG: T9SS type A sorting domain-containing protein [Saprospiraceae bacterium]|nr:T9SS type A sorting domain-containing protein [Candidatus Vicinibacter affinis]